MEIAIFDEGKWASLILEPPSNLIADLRLFISISEFKGWTTHNVATIFQHTEAYLSRL